MRIAVAGKGGVGKTTIAGTLARVLAEGDDHVLAMDADPNPNLALTLGVSRDRYDDIVPLPHGLLEHPRHPHHLLRPGEGQPPPRPGG